MSLSSHFFVDLIIMPDGTAFFKGCPGKEPGDEQHLLPVPDDCLAEVTKLREELPHAFMKRSAMEATRSIRYTFKDAKYRVADLHNVDDGQTWFLRRLPEEVPPFEKLGIQPELCNWLQKREHCQGLVLVSGAQASGKTTTASALLKKRLEKFGGHAISFENPAEMPIGGKWGEYGQCIQTEILSEKELGSRIEMAHRYGSPNIIFVGEIKTRFAALEVLRVALGSNQQMVIATIHGLDLIAALSRLINWAEELDGQNARQNLANSLLAIVRQNLSSDNGKLVLDVPEFLVVPFNQSDESIGIRAQLRDGNLQSLINNITEQQNRIAMQGFL